MSFRMNANVPLGPIAYAAVMRAVIEQNRKLLASDSFRQKATAEEIKAINESLLQAEAALQRYEGTYRGPAPVAGFATAGTMDPVSAAAAMCIVLIGAAMLSQAPLQKQLQQRIDDAMTNVKDKLSKIGERAGQLIGSTEVIAAVAAAATLVIQAVTVKTLEAELGLAPGRIKSGDPATILVITEAIKTLVGRIPRPPRCVDAETDYLEGLKQANTAGRTGYGSLNTTRASIWSFFLNATLNYVLCIKGKGGWGGRPPGGAAPA